MRHILYLWVKHTAMSTPDESDWKSEIGLLRKVLDALLEQNEALKAQNSLLRQQLESGNQFHSLPETPITTKQSIHSLSETQMTVKQSLHSPSETPQTVKQLTHSPSETQMTTKQSIYSLSETPQTVKQPQHSLSVSPVTAMQDTQPDPQQQEAASNETGTLPKQLPFSNENVYHLASQLYAAGFGGWKNDTTLAASKVLLHSYNKLPGSYAQLRKLTGYSLGGLAKLMMNLRKKGYLIKAGYQQHAVTGRALELMRKAGCK